MPESVGAPEGGYDVYSLRGRIKTMAEQRARS
jgi:hypothetical protein